MFQSGGQDYAPLDHERRRMKWYYQVLLMILFLVALNLWQSRGLLSADGSTPAPTFTLQALDGTIHTLNQQVGRRTVLYFFAPWCAVCHMSIGNLDTLRRWLGGRVETLAIALDYETEASVREFAGKNSAEYPILLGTAETAKAYAVSAFPTYYVVDESGNIVGRTQGYSTLVGLLIRSLL